VPQTSKELIVINVLLAIFSLNAEHALLVLEELIVPNVMEELIPIVTSMLVVQMIVLVTVFATIKLVFALAIVIMLVSTAITVQLVILNLTMAVGKSCPVPIQPVLEMVFAISNWVFANAVATLLEPIVQLMRIPRLLLSIRSALVLVLFSLF